MINSVICYRDQRQAAQLKDYLIHLCSSFMESLEIQVSIFPTLAETARHLEKNYAQVLVLDLTGQENSSPILPQLRKAHPDTEIILITAQVHPICELSGCCPFLFVRRKHLEQDLKEAFRKAVVNSLKNPANYCFSTTVGPMHVMLDYVLYLESADNYFTLHCADAKYKCRETLGTMEKELSGKGFFRISSSQLVNINAVKNLGPGGTLIMKNENTLYLSRSRTASFKKAYLEHLQQLNCRNWQNRVYTGPHLSPVSFRF